MKAYKILLCCGAGMSSGFLAQAAQKVANTKAPGTKVAAKSQSLVEDVIEDYDLLLIGRTSLPTRMSLTNSQASTASRWKSFRSLSMARWMATA